MNLTYASLQKYFKRPFAAESTAADVVDIASDELPDGTVSLAKGFTGEYSITETPVGYKTTERQIFNKLFQWITANLYVWSRIGTTQWDSAVVDDGGYDVGANVWLGGVNYRNKVAGNTNNPSAANSGWVNTSHDRTINGVSLDDTFDVNVESRLGTSIASNATTTIGTAGLGDTIHITGTTTITSFGAATNGVVRNLVFDGVLVLTHNAETLILKTNQNITTAVGDTATFVRDESAWRCLDYTKADGTPLNNGIVFGGQAVIDAGTAVDQAVSAATLYGNKKYMIVKEQAPYNTPALASVAGMNDRVLNTETFNNTELELVDNKIPLPVGVFKLRGSAPGANTTANVAHRIFIWDYTNNTPIITGTFENANYGDDHNATRSFAEDIIVVSQPISIGIKHEFAAASTQGLRVSVGTAFTNTADKVFTTLEIEILKLG